jgi:hypothetical protein
MAQVHQGEIIVPKKFSDSVREGEAVISGGAGGGGGGPMNITLNIDGESLGRIIFNKTKSGEYLISNNAVVVT